MKDPEKVSHIAGGLCWRKKYTFFVEECDESVLGFFSTWFIIYIILLCLFCIQAYKINHCCNMTLSDALNDCLEMLITSSTFNRQSL